MNSLFVGEKKEDIFKSLSAGCSRELREFSYVEQIRPSTAIKRSICKKCKVYLMPDRNERPPVDVTIRKGRLTRRCANCGHEVTYVCNPHYRSRNERAADEKA